MFWIGFIVGVFVGAFIGVALIALVSYGRQHDEDGVTDAKSCSGQRKDS